MDIIEWAEKIYGAKLSEPQKKILTEFESARRAGKTLNVCGGRISGKMQTLKIIDEFEKRNFHSV